MSRNVARIGIDGVDGGGILIPPPSQTSVFSDNKPIALAHQLLMSHFPCPLPGGEIHCIAFMVTSSTTVFVNNKGMIRKADMASCGHFIISGSSTVFAS